MKRAILASFTAACLCLVLISGASAERGAVEGPYQAATSGQQVMSGSYPYGISHAVDRDGARHVVGARRNGHLWYATDRGGSWTVKRIVSADTGNWVWALPSMAVDKNGRVHIAVVKAFPFDTPGGTGGIWYVTDKGRRRGDFGPRTRIAGPNKTEPALRVKGGVRYLAYATYALPGQRNAWLFFKTDRGGAWKRTQIANRSRTPSLRVDRRGRARIVYTTGATVRYVRAKTKVGKFSKPVVISAGRRPSGAPSLVLDPSGKPRVTWPSSKGGARIWYARRTASDWRTPVVLGRGSRTEISIDANGRPHAVLGSGRVLHAWLTANGWKREVVASGLQPSDSMGYRIGDVRIRCYGKRASIAWAPGGNSGGVWVAWS
jgi:hypothetical protein